ncbi:MULTISPECIES: hypothetical protein [Paenarthrobacter]|uniref:hypothetical protein n=1 Tax=Paenarthrobacter TaxID=1742992 RepID=UPI00074D2D4B|nr:hypothetical protein [Paenarthrobacter ureafaciens]AMB41647.1 hypothetical protein AUT26_16635 [Arthrobacter sp. ATCC 21022]KUR64489.1 hypothetical protein JM67_10690 [Arthrobacter sp. ATCC 21022]RWW94327.1 hypothetical protein AUR_06815 [Paenarthrobacter ureafaciens]GLU61723.1 hypothetical protein Pure01_42360 [Paenarthrobacter ureafaciens]GLU65999.1 hypothetical protein Pure02_42490 [Paenarthrobacter ureafaciens]
MTDDAARRTVFPGKAGSWLQCAFFQLIWTILVLSCVALTIEVRQQWPEFFVPGHAIGEFIQNLAHAPNWCGSVQLDTH